MVLINQKHINKCNQNKHELDDGTKFIVIISLDVSASRRNVRRETKKEEKIRQKTWNEITRKEISYGGEKKINKNEKKQPKHTKKMSK